MFLIHLPRVNACDRAEHRVDLEREHEREDERQNGSDHAEDDAEPGIGGRSCLRTGLALTVDGHRQRHLSARVQEGRLRPSLGCDAVDVEDALNVADLVHDGTQLFDVRDLNG